MNELVHYSATQLVEKMRGGVVSATEVLNAHVQMIEATNQEINALVTLCYGRASSHV